MPGVRRKLISGAKASRGHAGQAWASYAQRYAVAIILAGAGALCASHLPDPADVLAHARNNLIAEKASVTDLHLRANRRPQLLETLRTAANYAFLRADAGRRKVQMGTGPSCCRSGVGYTL